MNKNYSIVLALFLLFCVAVVFSRPALAQTENNTSKNVIQSLRSSAAREQQRKLSKNILQSLWSGNSGNILMFQVLRDSDLRKGLGISDEQHAQISRRLSDALRSNSEFVAIEKEMKDLRKLDDPFMTKADAATRQKMNVLTEKSMAIMMDFMGTIDRDITPNQKKRIQEAQLAGMSVFPVVTPDMFKALDLSEAQLKKMEAVRKESQPQFEQMMDQMINLQFKASDIVLDRLEKENIAIEDPVQFVEELKKMATKVKLEDPKFSQLVEEAMGKGQTFATQLKFKMFDILTDEQLVRLEEIVDNPPEHVQKFMDKIRTQRDANRKNSMQPVLDAWKPGEPIPDEYKQQRQKRK